VGTFVIDENRPGARPRTKAEYDDENENADDESFSSVVAPQSGMETPKKMRLNSFDFR
jgi:hypothetical protein